MGKYTLEETWLGKSHFFKVTYNVYCYSILMFILPWAIMIILNFCIAKKV